MIKQAELKKYQADQIQARTLDGELALRRAELLRRLDDNEPVQKGPLKPTVQETAVRRFSAEAVAAILGADKTAALKAQLPESIVRSLKVVEA